MKISEDTAASYLRDPRFVDLMASGKAATPGSGVWTREEVQRFLTRVAAGIEGSPEVPIEEVAAPGVKRRGRKPKNGPTSVVGSTMGDRLRAADLLGRSLGMFLDRVELNGDLKVSVTDLLDDDLKHAKTIVDIGGDKAMGDVDLLRTTSISTNRSSEVNEQYEPVMSKSTEPESTETGAE